MTDSNGRPVSRSLYAARAGERALTAQDLWNVPRVGAPVPSPPPSSQRWTTGRNSDEDGMWLTRAPSSSCQFC